MAKAKLPTGVEIRGKRLAIWFMYRGKRCRELLKSWEITPANIKRASMMRAVIQSEIQLGQFDYATRFPTSKRAAEATIASGPVRQVETFGQLVDAWLENREPELARNTMKKTRSQMKTIKFIVGPDRALADINHNDILGFRNALLHGRTFYQESLRSNKDGRTVRTVNDYVGALCTVLRFAYRSGFIREKPYEDVKKLKRSNTKPDPLLRDEYDQLVMALDGQRRFMWTIAIFTGLRHGELAALAWEDIDLDKGELRVSRNLTSLGEFGPPKTQAGFRTVTLLAPAVEALRAQRLLTGLHRPTEITYHHREYGSTERQRLRFVFVPRPSKGEQRPHYGLSSIGARWNAAVKRAGIRPRNPYQTRHTFACWLLTAGANPSFIAAQMGHENAQMVYEIYGKWIEQMNGDQVAMLNDRLAI